MTSWKRCQSHKVHVSQDSAPLISEAEDFRHRTDSLWLSKCAMPTLERCGNFLNDANSMMILTDPTGVIIETKGDDRSINIGEEIHLQRGGRWAESDIGTNAIGVALAGERPVQIHAAEHYCEKVQKWTCAAAPIFHPIDGILLGVIDISGPASTFSSQSLAFAVAAAENIQAVMAKSIGLDHWKLLQRFRSRHQKWPNEESIVVDRRGTIVCVTGNALTIAKRLNKTAITDPHIPCLRVTSFSRWEATITGLLPSTKIELVADAATELGAIIVFSTKSSTRSVNKISNSRDHEIEFDGFVEVLLSQNLSRKPLELTTSARTTRRFSANSDQDNRPKLLSNSTSAESGLVLIADDPKVHDIVARVTQASIKGMAILIGGETGTGKELLARRAHAGSGRKGAFIPVNCAAIPESLVESELFGYADGAFSGARQGGSIGLVTQADGGTLFLDEIGDMPIELQTVLLRLLDDWMVRPISGSPRKSDVLLISATNVNLEAAVAEGRIRRDLFYRLNTLQVNLPPLSYRSDFEVLARHLLTTIDDAIEIEPEALTQLSKLSWPGNIRELKNVLSRLSLNATGGTIKASDITDASVQDSQSCTFERLGAGTLRELMHAHVLATHIETNGNIAETARRLDVSRNTVYRQLGHDEK